MVVEYDGDYPLKQNDENYVPPDYGAFCVFHGVDPRSGQRIYLVMHRARCKIKKPDGTELVFEETLGVPGGGLKIGTEEKPEQTEHYNIADEHDGRLYWAKDGAIMEVAEELVRGLDQPVLYDLERAKFRLENSGMDKKTKWHGFSYELNSKQIQRLLDWSRSLNTRSGGVLTKNAKETRESLLEGSNIEVMTIEMLTASEVKALKLPFAYKHECDVLASVIAKHQAPILKRVWRALFQKPVKLSASKSQLS
jgi:hypothetical protein